MRIKGVLLGTVDEQRKGGDENPIDPNIIELPINGVVPVTLNFDRTKTLGKVSRVWREDGRLLFEAELGDDKFTKHVTSSREFERTAAIGVRPTETEGELETYKIKKADVFAISIGMPNANADQPVWEEIT